MSSRRTAPRAGTPVRKGTGAPARRSPEVLLGGAALLAVLVVLAVVLMATVGRDGEEETAAAGGDAPAGMAHVHGLGVDPADGQLYAASHYGLFRVPDEGDAAPVAGRVQDFMGFTVVGAGNYLASGHPGAGQDAPANLGLIETKDGGQTWQTLSLEGEADFHALEAKHGRVYGWNAGRFMVSEDKKSWDERGEILLADFAVSPQDPDTVVVTTQQGVGVTTDGGRTFRGVRGAPVLQLVTWTDAGTLVGVDPEGTVQVSEDDGTTWERRGAVDGQPAAVTAADEDVYVATADGRIEASSDGGRTFRTRYQE